MRLCVAVLAAVCILGGWGVARWAFPEGRPLDVVETVDQTAPTRERSGPNDPQLAPIAGSPDAASPQRTPASNRRIELDIPALDGTNARALFLTSAGSIVTRKVRNRAILDPSEPWTHVVVSFSSGEKLLRERVDLSIAPDGTQRLTGELTEWTLPVRDKGMPIDTLTPEWAATQTSPAPPAALAEASDWSSGRLPARMEEDSLFITVDSTAEAIQLRVERPFALGTAELSPRLAIRFEEADRGSELELWWPATIRCLLSVPDAFPGLRRAFDVHWEFFDLDRVSLRRARKSLQVGEAYSIAAPVGSDSVRLTAFDGGASPVAQVGGEIVRRDQLFELKLDPRVFTVQVEDHRGDPVAGATLRSGGGTLAMSDWSGMASVPRHAVSPAGAQVRHPEYDTALIPAERVSSGAQLGGVHRVELGPATALRFRSVGASPSAFIISVSADDLVYEDIEQDVEPPDVEGLCGADEDHHYFCSSGSSPATVLVQSDFNDRARANGVRYEVRDCFGSKIGSHVASMQRGGLTDVEVSAKGFKTFTGTVVAEGGGALQGAVLDGGTMYGSATIVTAGDGTFSFDASSSLNSIEVQCEGFVSKPISSLDLASDAPIVLEAARDVMIYVEGRPDDVNLAVRARERQFRAEKMRDGAWKASGIPRSDVTVTLSHHGIERQITIEDDVTSVTIR